MCGIAALIGPGANETRFAPMLASLAPRGDAGEQWMRPGLVLGTHRLRIVDRDRAVQPWHSADGRWVLSYNGEIYNHRQLHSELAAAGVALRSLSDTEVVCEALGYFGDDAVHRLRGDFAFVRVEAGTGRAFLARDPVGVKPLYWAQLHDGTLAVASEVKALVPLGVQVHEVPPGHCGWAEPRQAPKLRAYVDLLRLGDNEPPITDLPTAKAAVRAAFADAVRVRVDTDLPVGVVLSGGLDSSLVLRHAAMFHDNVTAFTVGAPSSPDLEYARRLTAELGVRHEVVELRPRDIDAAAVRRAIRMSELSEYGDVINAVVSVPLFARVHALGLKVVLAGDGSDELFGGYDMYAQIGADKSRRLFQYKLHNLARTELQRVDRTSMGQGVEVRVPFLDLELVKLAMRLPIDFKVRDGVEKWLLRQAFADVLPEYILQRPKNPMSHSSGLHERARVYKPLFPRWYRECGYEALGPMRRDFSLVLTDHDMDLDAARAAIAARPDYTFGERVKDLAGALRWNLAAMRR